MKRLIRFFTRLCEAYLPDAFVFCLILTLIVYLAAALLTPHSPVGLVSLWGKDFWALNAFAMQMVFVLISGHMLATAPLMKKGIDFITSKISSESTALVVLSLFSVIACWINWGFGLIISGIMAVALARKLGKVNFGLFVATGYAGFLVWHGGLSGSIPLKIAGKDEMMERVYPGLTVPLSETIFAHYNLLLVALLLLALPMLALWMRTDEKVEVAPESLPPAAVQEGPKTFRDRIENHWFLNVLFFIFFLVVLIRSGNALEINTVNMIFLSLAILLHKTPANFLKALQNSIGNASGIIIQFPFYGALMGLMQHSGLADQISQIFVNISTPTTLPLWAFLSGGLVNFFVPSGGGQWVVQGPIMLKAAQELAVDPGKISMALAWGDAWTNMIQPFWALPLLALANIKLKDIMGYCLIYLLVSGVIITGVFYLT